MLSELRQLFAGLTPRGRFWLALAIVAAILAAFMGIVYTGGDLTPFWHLLLRG